nr:Hsp70 family protein [Chitinophagales bacterium]
EQSIDIKPQYGLTDTEVEKMLLESITHAKVDMQLRSVLEAKTEAQQVLLSAYKFLHANAALLSPEEGEGMKNYMVSLKASLETNDKDMILLKMEELNEYTQPFAQRVMDAVISKAMKGRRI